MALQSPSPQRSRRHIRDELIIERLRNGPAEARFGGFDQVENLARRHVVEVEM